MPKQIKTFIKVKGTDFKYEAEGENMTYSQMVKHYLSVLKDEPLIAELAERGFIITKKDV